MDPWAPDWPAGSTCNVDNGSTAGKNAFLQIYSTRPNVPWRPWTRAAVPAKEQV